MSTEQDLLNILTRRQLSSVEFVHDYVQLHFDGPTLTAITRPTVIVGGNESRWGDTGYRDVLCAFIGVVVREVFVALGEAVRLDFENGNSIVVSLKHTDYRAHQAVSFDVSVSEWWEL
jgi:hypothetical protein